MTIRQHWIADLGMCLAGVTFALGCDAGAEQAISSQSHELANCVVVSAGEGFVDIPLPDATSVATVEFFATPSVANIDAVMGMSSGPATAFSDLATAVRFAPTGLVDARNSADYGADVAAPYQAGEPWVFRMTADLASHTYSVLHSSPANQLARNYKFRSTQSSVANLDTLSVIVDGSEGSVQICEVRVTPAQGIAYTRTGAYDVVALPGDQALISDGEVTERLDADGRTVALLPRGGQIATDAAGNVFVARIENGMVALYKYTAGFVQQWRTTSLVPAGATKVAALSVANNGAIMVATLTGLETWRDGELRVTWFTAAGGFAGQFDGHAGAVAFDSDTAVIGSRTDAGPEVARIGVGGVVWTKLFPGSADITAIAADPSGAILFGGELHGPMSFGGDVLPSRSNPEGEVNGFVVKLLPTGDHVFSRRTGYTFVDGIAANSTRVVVSSTERTQLRYYYLQSFEAASGAPAAASAFNSGLDVHGKGGGVVISETGKVWWTIQSQWREWSFWPHLFVIEP